MTGTAPSAVRYFDGDSTDELSRYVILASHLPRGGGPAAAAKCKHCGHFLGALVNSKGIVFGSFTRRPGEFECDELQGVAKLTQTVTLTCPKCRKNRTYSFDKR
jgi:hypothetical protein